jgi:KUP system potassium uptake protein
MEHHTPDDVIVQVNAAAVAAVDERSSTSQIGDAVGDDDRAGKVGTGITRRTFSESYKMRHRNPLVRPRRRDRRFSSSPSFWFACK